MSSGKDLRDLVMLERFIAEAARKIAVLDQTMARLGAENPESAALQAEKERLERSRAALEARRRNSSFGAAPRGGPFKV